MVSFLLVEKGDASGKLEAIFVQCLYLTLLVSGGCCRRVQLSLKAGFYESLRVLDQLYVSMFGDPERVIQKLSFSCHKLPL